MRNTTPSRPQVIRLHVNRREMLKGSRGYPWTIHTSKACIPAKQVDIRVPCSTLYEPQRPSNPRLFIYARARVQDLGAGRYALVH